MSELYHETGVGPHDSWTEGQLSALIGLVRVGCYVSDTGSLPVRRYGASLARTRKGSSTHDGRHRRVQIRGLPQKTAECS